MRFSYLIQMFVFTEILMDFAQGADCRSCSLSQVHIVPGDNHRSVTPIIMIPTLEADGCLQTIVACDVRGIPNAVTHMAVN